MNKPTIDGLSDIYLSIYLLYLITLFLLKCITFQAPCRGIKHPQIVIKLFAKIVLSQSSDITVLQQHAPLSVTQMSNQTADPSETFRLWLSDLLPRRANRGASEQPVVSHPGHSAGLPPQLRWPHPGLHRRTHRGGRQRFPNVGTHVPLHTACTVEIGF